MVGRREVVASGGAVLAGAIGAGRLSLGGAAASGGQSSTFEWSCPDIELLSDAGPSIGATRAAMGQLDSGGQVYVTQTITDADVTDGAVDRIEQHVFVTSDGQIIGVGSVTGATGEFAVVGGTGRFVGASGSYTANFDDELADGLGPVSYIFTVEGSN